MSDAHQSIETIRQHFKTALPSVYMEFLAGCSERVRDDGLLLYQASDVVERNMTFGVERFTPEFLAVGDDSGGRLIVIRFADSAAAPFVIDAAALVPNRPPSLLVAIAPSWNQWSENGFPL